MDAKPTIKERFIDVAPTRLLFAFKHMMTRIDAVNI
jgi:hypothetical protein